MRRAGGAVLKVAVAALLVYWLWRSRLLDVALFGHVELDWVLVGVLGGQLLSLGLPLVRWYWLLRARAVGLPPTRAAQIGLISYFAAILLPATGGQDVVRLFYGTRARPGRGADIVATLLLDRVLGLLGLCVVGILAGIAMLVRTGADVVLQVVAIASGLLLLLSATTGFLLRSKPKEFARLIARQPKLAALFSALEAFRGRKGVLLSSLLVSIAAQLGNCVSMYFGFRALGTPVNLLEAAALTPLVTLTTVVPATPLSIGVSDAAAEGLFALVGAATGAEVTMLVRAATALGCLAGGLAYLMPAPKAPAAPPQRSATAARLPEC